MAYLIGSASTAAYTTARSYNNNSTYAMFSGDNTQGIVASASGTGARLNMYINSWTSASIKACLYDNSNALINTLIIPSSVGTGLVTVIFPNTTITSGQKYRLAFYLVASGGISLWTKTGALQNRDVSTGSYTSPVATLPSGTFVSTNEFYWSLETAPSYSITDIDGDDSVQLAQTFTINTVGYTGQPTASTNDARVTVTVTGGSSNVWTATVNDRAEGVATPQLPTSPITLTLTNGAETSNRTFTLTKKSTETLVTFTSANTSDPTYLTYHFAQLGYTVEAAQFYYIGPGGMSDLLVLGTGGIETTNLGTFTGWLRPTTGLGAGNAYFFNVTVTAGGVVVVTRTNNLPLGVGIGIGI